MKWDVQKAKNKPKTGEESQATLWPQHRIVHLRKRKQAEEHTDRSAEHLPDICRRIFRGQGL